MTREDKIHWIRATMEKHGFKTAAKAFKSNYTEIDLIYVYWRMYDRVK